MDISTTFQNFKNEWQTHRIADPTLGQLGANSLPASQWYQCVSLIKQYLRECYGINAGFWGDAIVYWTGTNPNLLTKFYRVGNSAAQVGDIVVLSPNHIGIATGNINDVNVEILEQNGQTGGGTGLGGDAIRTRWVARSRVAGLLRPIGEPAAAPAPPVPAHSPTNVGRKLVLSADATSWHVYHTLGPWTIPYAIAVLNPHQYGGLTYDILGNPAANVYIIQTQMFGQVAIYAGPDTPAQFVDEAPAAAPVPVVPAPAPVPAKPANIVYTKLDSPLNLVTNRQPTRIWDLGFADDAHATELSELPQGASFVAYGRAQRTDKDKPAYFMSQADFGDADTSGIPAKNEGINTVDLSPAPPAAPAPAPAAPVADGEQVKVTVIPADPNAWKTSYTRYLSPVPYKANQNATIKDVDGLDPDTQLVDGQKVTVAGEFSKDGKKYYRTVHSVTTNSWYGLPEETLTRQADIVIDNFLDKTLNDAPKLKLEAGILNGRQKALATAATVDGFFSRLVHRKNKK